MPLELLRTHFDGDPALDTAVSRQILEEVARGDRPDTFRLHVPQRLVAFGRRDVSAPGYPAAVAAAREAGFAAIERLAGGRAAVFHTGTLAFSWAQRVDDPRVGIQPRFERVADLMCSALRDMGVDAEVGELPGEYCPGAYSVHARAKLVGIGQRLIGGAAHIGGVIVVRDADAIRRALTPVYRALHLRWRPETAGAVEDEIPGVTVEAVADHVVARLGSEHDLERSIVGPETLAQAEARVPEFHPREVAWQNG